MILTSYPNLRIDEIVEYKRIYHLKSLDYNNTYFNMPKNTYQLQWPATITDKLYNKKIIHQILEDFQPGVGSLDLSEIERIGESS